MQLRVECSFLLVQRWNHGGKRHAVESGVVQRWNHGGKRHAVKSGV